MATPETATSRQPPQQDGPLTVAGQAMDAAAARRIAAAAHLGQRTRSGEPVFEHLARVAAAVPPAACATAWLHDLLERSDVRVEDLCAQGLTAIERDALELLTRPEIESYELYALRIAHARGRAGDLARCVKLADLDDHILRAALPDDPPYAWARRHIANAAHAEQRAR
jgi:hypothetical protein